MIHVIYRTPYATPTSTRLVTFDDVKLYDWFDRVWPVVDGVPVESEQWYEIVEKTSDEIGLDWIYGFWFLIEEMAKHPKPADEAELEQWLHHRHYPEGTIVAGKHAFEANTDNDETDLSVMVFDDHYRKTNPQRVEFLLREQWELPTNVQADHDFDWDGKTNFLQPDGNNEGCVWACLMVIDDCCWLSDLLGPFKFTGTRLPELVEFLREVPDEVIEQSEAIDKWHAPGKWRKELIALRAIARESPITATGELLQAYDQRDAEAFEAKDSRSSFWTYARGQTRFQISDHMAQVTFVSTSTPREGKSHDTNVRWILFDDCWAATHPVLAESILWAASKDTPLF